MTWWSQCRGCKTYIDSPWFSFADFQQVEGAPGDSSAVRPSPQEGLCRFPAWVLQQWSPFSDRACENVFLRTRATFAALAIREDSWGVSWLGFLGSFHNARPLFGLP